MTIEMFVTINKLYSSAITPTYSRKGDAGLDITCLSYIHDMVNDFYEYSTGLEFEIPEGYVGLLFPRSSISKKDLLLCNSVGVLDSSYRGEVTFRFRATKDYPRIYKPGDRIGQIIIVPYPKITFVEGVLSFTDRDKGGYGSTGT